MNKSMKRQEALAGWTFMIPALIIFAALVVFPIIMSLFLTFTEWNFLSGFEGIEWVGFDNIVRMFTRDRKFEKALTNTILYAFTTAPISIVLALLFAYMLNDKVYFKKMNRMFMFIPYICSMVALAAVFRFLFRSDGPINAILMNLGIIDEPLKWLNSSQLNRIPVICVMVYAGIGFNLIVYMAALQSVPRELYEAATMDGASGFIRFMKITVPLISPTTFYLLVVRLIAAFKAFSAVSVMGADKTAPSLVTEIYSNAFGSYKFGYGSAEAWVLVAIILVVTLIQMWGQKKWVHY